MTSVELSSIEDLDDVRLDLDGDYILTKNLDFDDDNSYDDSSNKSTYTTGSGWSPIGTFDVPFIGVFDGDNYSISNLFISRSSTDDVGFFGALNKTTLNLSVTVKNIVFEDPQVTGNKFVGIVAGLTVCRETASTIVENVHVKNSVRLNVSDNFCGIFIGYNEADVSECSVDGDSTNNLISTYNSSTGSTAAFIGRVRGGTISNCYVDNVFCGINTSFSAGPSGFTADLYDSSGSGLNVGIINKCFVGSGVEIKGNRQRLSGFVGTNRSTISNCYTLATISSYGSAEFQRGFAFTVSGSTIEKCYTAAVINDPISANVIDGTGGTISDFFYDNDVSTYSSTIGGTGKTTAEMKDIDTYTDTVTTGLDEAWDMVTKSNHNGLEATAIWFIDSGNDYPRLWFEYEAPEDTDKMFLVF